MTNDKNEKEFDIGGFRIDAKPTADDDYNWIHTSCETIASTIAMTYSPPGERVVGIFRLYRDHIESNLESVDSPVDIDLFVNWLGDQAETRNIGVWEGEMFQALDDMFVYGVATRELSPERVLDHFSEYVDRTTAEMDLEEFFERYE